MSAGSASIHDRLTSLLFSLLNLTPDQVTQWQQDRIQQHGNEDGALVFAAELHELTQLLLDFFEQPPSSEDDQDPPADEEQELQINLTRTIPPMDKLEDEDAIYHAPPPNWTSIAFYEFSTIMSSIERYLNTNEANDLHQLIATLYRPAKPATSENISNDYQGDIRLPYLDHESTVARRAERIAQLPEPIKQLIWFYALSSRHAIVQQFTKVFKSESQKEGADYTSQYGYAAIMMELAEGVKHLNQVASTKTGTVLTYLSYSADKSDEQKINRALNK